MLLISRLGLFLTEQLRGDSLKARSARGATILGFATAGERVLRLMRNMLLARILAPDAFGTIAMVLAASSIFETLSDVGIRQAVIQSKKGEDTSYLNVTWWFQSLRGLGMYLIGILIAPWVSRFYDMPELLPLLRVAFIAMVFNGLVSPRAYVLEKRLQFGRCVLLSQGSGLISTLLTIGLAVYLRNVWALVIGLVLEAIVRDLISFVLCPFRPRLTIDRNNLRELLSFSKGMFGLSFLSVLISQIPVIVLGKIVSGEQLGMYYMAFQLAYQPVKLYDRVIGSVLLPAFAEKQDNKESICRAMLAIVRTTSVFGAPLLAFMVTYAKPILSLVYGSQYAQVSVPFALLCFWGLVFTQAIIVSSIFIGIGLPYLHRRAVVLRALLLASLIYPSVVYWGLSGAATAVLVAYSVALIAPFVWMRKLINLKLSEYGLSWLAGFWLAPVVLFPALILRPAGACSWKTDAMFSLIGLFISYLVYFCWASSRKKSVTIH